MGGPFQMMGKTVAERTVAAWWGSISSDGEDCFRNDCCSMGGLFHLRKTVAEWSAEA